MHTVARDNPDRKLTLREAFEKHYDTTELSIHTVEKKRSFLGQWEKQTDDPPIGEIDHETLALFRAGCINDSDLAPATIMGYRAEMNAILRRLAPPAFGNPMGLSIIDRVPFMKGVRVIRKRPYRIPLEDLSRFYVGCQHAEFPKMGILPALFWRTLIVIAYFTGLRKKDILTMRFEQLDLRARTLEFVAGKTGKDDVFPLHPLVVNHIHLIRKPVRGELFPGIYHNGGFFYREMKHIAAKAGIVHPFKLHDIRRTAASEIDRVDRGLGRVLLQHAPQGVTETSYLNVFEELDLALEKMRVPDAFRLVPMVDGPTRRADWVFGPGSGRYRGKWFPLGPRTGACLRALVAAGRPLDADALFRLVWWDRPDASIITVRTTMYHLRNTLRRHLDLPALWNPVVQLPSIDGWQLCLP